MDIGKAIGFVFEDKDWVTKLLLGAALMLIPIFGQLVVGGYVIAVVRRVMAGDPQPLPAWDNIGGYFMDGLMLFVANMVYGLPIWIITCPIAVVWVLPALGPLIGGENTDVVGTLTAALTGVAGLVTIGGACLATIFGVFLSLVQPVLEIRFAKTGQLGSLFQVGEVFRFLFANLGSIIVAMLVMWAAGVVIGGVASVVFVVFGLLPCLNFILIPVASLLALPFTIWTSLLAGHLYGQIGRQAVGVPVAV